MGFLQFLQSFDSCQLSNKTDIKLVAVYFENRDDFEKFKPNWIDFGWVITEDKNFEENN